jgi:hypothetical protein
MPLHRDIYWVGRQWAVTGYGMQAIDQKLNGIFDIEVSGLWDDSLSERMHALKWLNAADFDKGRRGPQALPATGPTSRSTRRERFSLERRECFSLEGWRCYRAAEIDSGNIRHAK